MKFVVFFLCVLPGLTMAAEPFCKTGRPHPIDVQLEKDLDKTGGVTVSIREAQSKATELWDKELNKTYKQLMSTLDPEDQNLLKKSQRSWLAFREAQTPLWWSESFFGSGGTLGPIVVSERAREFMKQRVCELQELVKLRQENQ